MLYGLIKQQNWYAVVLIRYSNPITRYQILLKMVTDQHPLRYVYGFFFRKKKIFFFIYFFFFFFFVFFFFLFRRRPSGLLTLQFSFFFTFFRRLDGLVCLHVCNEY